MGPAGHTRRCNTQESMVRIRLYCIQQTLRMGVLDFRLDGIVCMAIEVELLVVHGRDHNVYCTLCFRIVFLLVASRSCSGTTDFASSYAIGSLCGLTPHVAGACCASAPARRRPELGIRTTSCTKTTEFATVTHYDETWPDKYCDDVGIRK